MTKTQFTILLTVLLLFGSALLWEADATRRAALETQGNTNGIYNHFCGGLGACSALSP